MVKYVERNMSPSENPELVLAELGEIARTLCNACVSNIDSSMVVARFAATMPIPKYGVVKVLAGRPYPPGQGR